ncbi:quinohemoprotein amine dehydrogenase subunit alpha, partial [Pseudomonas laurentiana]|nr:quinohemoprotein amine dehydrogenase subunit alpha [Pseudomonas laurentiana]
MPVRQCRRPAGVGGKPCLAAQTSQAREAQAILKETCMACHTPEGENALSRISHQRKTPEG